MKWYQMALFLINMILFIFSFGFLGEIGPSGLLCFALYMISGGYIVTFFVVNWDVLTKK